MTDHTKEVLVNLGGLVSLINLTWFAFQTWTKRQPPTSTATWLMWTILDGILWACTAADHKPYMLPLSYTVGAFLVLVAQLKQGTWKWTKGETICALGAAVSIWIWRIRGPEAGVIFAVIAMTSAGLPFVGDMVKNPIRNLFTMFFVTAIACALTLIGTWWTVGGSLTALCGIIFNGAMAILAFRKVPVLEDDETLPRPAHWLQISGPPLTLKEEIEWL